MNKTIVSAVIAGTMLTGGTLTADQMQNPYTDKTSHYELSVASDVMQGDKVEVSKDEPKLTLSRWNDEARITIEPVFQGVGKVSKANRPLMSKKLEYKKGDVTAFIEPKNASEFDIDFTLESKPASNVFEYKITGAENYDFFYQPELTPEEIAKGMSRPENVIGSYAVYHKEKSDHETGKTNYETGKVMHIYRPKAIDANGDWVWAQLTYVNSKLSVTVPPEFLINATYPVVVDPTFGYTSQGASDAVIFSGGADNAAAQRGDVAGTVTAIAAYIRWFGFSAGSKAFALSTNNSGKPNSSFSYTSSYTAVSSTSYTLESISGLSQAITNPYWVIITGASSGFTGYVAYDTGGAAGYGAYRDDVNVWSSDSNRYSVYATYTASGGATASDITSDFIQFN